MDARHWLRDSQAERISSKAQSLGNERPSAMNSQQWLVQVRAELSKRKLPSLYVERLVSELSDHLTDCTEDRMSTDARDLQGVFERFGSPQQVASGAAQAYRPARFSGRHPILMFVVLPIISLPVLWLAFVTALVATLSAFGIKHGTIQADSSAYHLAQAALPYLLLSMLLVPATLAAAFFCRLARNATLHWKWPLMACGLIAVFAGLSIIQFSLPGPASHGTLSFGFSLSDHPSPSQWLQFLLPLAIGGWAAWRSIKTERPRLAK